jgi:hypothetical protein
MTNKKASNIISGKNAIIMPEGESLKTTFDKIVVENHKDSLARSHKRKVPVNIGTYHYAEANTTGPTKHTGNPADAIGTILQDAGTPISTGQPATLLYKKLPDDMILITGFEGFLSLDELEKKYGKEIADTYFSYDNHMAKEYYADGEIIINVETDDENRDIVRPGSVYEKVEFSKLIAHVKKCGGLLHDIIQVCNGGEVKRIEI